MKNKAIDNSLELKHLAGQFYAIGMGTWHETTVLRTKDLLNVSKVLSRIAEDIIDPYREPSPTKD